jgi:hypothetical protein
MAIRCVENFRHKEVPVYVYEIEGVVKSEGEKDGVV